MTPAPGVPAEQTAIGSRSPEFSSDAARVGPWQRFAFGAARFGLAVMLRVLGLRGLYAFGRFFGTLEWLVNYRRRRRFHQWIAGLLGDSITTVERRAFCRSLFVRTRCDKIFYLIFDAIGREKALAAFDVEGLEFFDRALARGRGCLLIMAHYGAHHVGAMYMALRGYRLAGIRDRNEGGIRRYVQELYDRRYPEFGRMRVLFADSFPRDIYRCFSDNYIVGAALDVQRSRGDRKQTATVRLFGEEQEFLVGTLRIALRCRAPVVMGLVVSEPDFRYRGIAIPLLEPDESIEESPELIRTIMQRYADHIESFVRQHPDHVSRI